METKGKHQQFLEDEWYHVRYSGEIPEIALHSAIHYLTADSEGPLLILGGDDLIYLQSAAAERFFEIIVRDINPANRDTPAYRGVLRTIANWRRYKRFCERHQLSYLKIKAEVRDRLLSFLTNEIADVSSGRRRSSMNCTYEELHSFGVELSLPFENMQSELQQICPV